MIARKSYNPKAVSSIHRIFLNGRQLFSGIPFLTYIMYFPSCPSPGIQIRGNKVAHMSSAIRETRAQFPAAEKCAYAIHWAGSTGSCLRPEPQARSIPAPAIVQYPIVPSLLCPTVPDSKIQLSHCALSPWPLIPSSWSEGPTTGAQEAKAQRTPAVCRVPNRAGHYLSKMLGRLVRGSSCRRRSARTCIRTTQLTLIARRGRTLVLSQNLNRAGQKE